tara:strand:+ start:416 stop:841 length:426 start_codon:yes stop_codon:yes gene_type:complete
MRRLILFLVLLVGAYLGYEQGHEQPRDTGPAASQAPSSIDSLWRGGSQVSGNGTVVRILSDDNDGSRHQRFILELASGRSVLVAHNIDLAPRVSGLSVGDTVAFFGQFETNDRGGVIHWTHKDPQRRHVDGWLQHKGKRFD